MPLREELEKQGNWLFRRRSYILPFAFPFLLIALVSSPSSEAVQGDVGGRVYIGLCLAVSFFGLTIRCITVGHVPKGTSGRNTTGQIAESLNTTGLYSVHRHPLYLGNFVIYVGIVLSVQVWWFAALMILAIFLYLERIMLAEEEFLRGRFGAPYLEWADKTPAYWPNFKQWQPPGLPFSFRNVLKREYTGFFAIIAAYTFLEVLRNYSSQGTLNLESEWLVLFSVGLLTYLVLRTLKKKTGLLDVEGR